MTVASPAMRTGEGFSGYRHTHTRPIYRCDVRRRTHPHANETFLLFCFIFIFPKSSNSKSSTSLSQEKSQFRKVLRITSPQTLTQRDSYKSNPLSCSSPGPPCTATTPSPPLPATPPPCVLSAPHPTFNPSQLILEPWRIHDHLSDPKRASGGWPMVGIHHPPSAASALCG